MRAKKDKFKKTLIYMTVVCSIHAVAYAQEVVPIDSNPHSLIGLTQDISAQYNGKNVQIGVLDSGFILEHPFIDHSKVNAIIFETVNSDGVKKLSNPNVYDSETIEKEGIKKNIYSSHGGKVVGIIGAKSSARHQYAGGVAQNSQLYVVQFESNKIATGEVKKVHSEPSLLISPESQDERTDFAAAIQQFSSKPLLAINNSWNEDSVGNTVQEMDNVYKQAIQGNQQNSLINAIKQVVKNDTLLVFAAGNESKKQPGIMAALPHYLPELEDHYLSVIAVDADKNLAEYSNYCGISKRWCVAAPGNLAVIGTDGVDSGEKIPSLELGEGTSFAAPVVTGALAVVKDRFDYFTPTQVRDTLLSTATDLGEQGVDDKFGWGLINLSKAIHGPSTLLKDETYKVDRNDQWSNTLVAEHYLTKQGSGELKIEAENNRLKGVNIDSGKLVLKGKTSVDHVNNQAELAVTDLTIHQAYHSSPTSMLEIQSTQAITVQGKNTVVHLDGKLHVAEDLQRDAQAGSVIANVITLKDDANYQGGFNQLYTSDALLAQGLRQDLYFKDDRIEVRVNENNTFTDPNANENGISGLRALNELRDSSVAWRKGIYNDWLQKAIEQNQLQNFHYFIGNNLYADSLAFLHNHAADRLNYLTDTLSWHHDMEMNSVKVWSEGNHEKYKFDQINPQEKGKFETQRTDLGIAYKPTEQVTLAGNLSYAKSEIERAQASATAKQLELGAGLRYLPRNSHWFVDVAGKIAHVDYKQHRTFNRATLGEGKNKGWWLGGEARTGYLFNANNWLIEPYVGLQALQISMSALKEQGDLATATGRHSRNDLNLLTGLQIKKSFDVGSWALTPHLSINYIQRLNHSDMKVTSHLARVAIDSQSVTFGKKQTEMQVGIMFAKGNWSISTGVTHKRVKNGKSTTGFAKVGYMF